MGEAAVSGKLRWDRPKALSHGEGGSMPAAKGWRMRSKIPGRCPRCKAVYEVGDWILYLGKGKGVLCATCARLRPL